MVLPRVAHAVGDNLQRNPDDILKPPATVPIWDRFILGHHKRDEREAEEHLLYSETYRSIPTLWF